MSGLLDTVGMFDLAAGLPEQVAAAAEAGITVFDTARAYGDNERLLADGLRRAKADTTARIVTCLCFSTVGFDVPPSGSPQMQSTSVPGTAYSSSSIASVSILPSFAV